MLYFSIVQHLDIFKDLFVLELASALAGPSVGMFFAELGAKVVKIENKLVGGDVTRKWKHPTEANDDPYSAYYYATNWKKESILLDLNDSTSMETLYSFVEKADIVVANFKKNSANKLGLDYKNLRALNPKIIYASVNAYGQDDPRPGFDALMQAEAGWMSINGAAKGPPTKMPLPLIDILAGHQLKEGILVALLKRGKSGLGCEVSVSLFDAAVSTLANQASTFLNLNITPKRNGSRHPSIAPYGDTVQTSEGQYFLLAVGTNEQFLNLCDLLNLKEVKGDNRFSNNQNRQLYRDLLIKLLQDEIIKMSKEQFLTECKKYNIPIGPIRNIKEVLTDENTTNLILQEKVDGQVSRRVKSVVFNINTKVE